MKRITTVLAGLVLAAGCSSNPYDYETWTKKLGDQKEAERAVTELEQLGNPNAIPALGKAWADQGKPVRLLQVIISLARPLTPKEAEEKFFTDYQESGRPASWDKALPFLQQAIDEIDENNPRSVESAQKAAGALGEAKLADGLDALIKLSQKEIKKKWITAQIDAVRSIGEFGEADKAKARGALEKLLDRDPPDNPKTAADKAAAALLNEKFGLFLGVSGAAINALGELHDPAATKTLVLALYRTPELFTQTRRALVALGPTAEDALRQTLQGKYAPVEELFTAKKLDKYCGDKHELPPEQCQSLSAKDFYPAVVLGDFYDPKSVPDLLAALQRPPLPVYFQDADTPSPNTQVNAIFDALRKIGSVDAAVTVRGLWMTGAAAAPKPGAKPGAPAAGGKDAGMDVKIQAISTYPFLTRDTIGVKELGDIAADNKADENLRTEAATAFARLASSKEDIAILLGLSKKYLDESAKRAKQAAEKKPAADAADKELEKFKKASDDAKTAALTAAKNASLKTEEIKAATDAAKKAEETYKEQKKKHREAVAPFKQLEADQKAYKGFARMFQTHAARIEVAIRCQKKLECFVGTLKETEEDAAKHLQGYIKDENGKDEDLSKWTKDEKLGLLEGEVERAMLEVGKAGAGATQHTAALLDAVKSTDRLIRQSILLALPKIAKVPCESCESKLDDAIKAGEGKVTLGDLNLETTMLRNYFAWAGGRVPHKKTATDDAPAGGGAAPAKADDKPAEKADDKPAEDKPAEKAPEKKAEEKKPEPAKAPAKAPPAAPKKPGKK